MQTSLPGGTHSRAALHLHEGHFYAPSQPADQFAQAGWSVGSAAALLGMRARSSSGREASPSSELAVLRQAAPSHFSGRAQQPEGDAAAHVTQPGKEMWPAPADSSVQAVPDAAKGQSSHAPHATHSSRHASCASSVAGPGSLPGAGASCSGHSSAPVSPMHALGRAGSSRHSSDDPALSRLRSSNGFQGRHTMPRSLQTFARGNESSMSQPGSAAGLPTRQGDSSPVLYSDEGMQASQQHPLQGHWGLAHASEVDQHNFALERSYSPSSSNGSAASAHEEDDVPFAGEDSHVLSEWGQEPDRNLYNHGSDLLPQRFPFGQPLHRPQSNGTYSGSAQGSARSLPGASGVSSASLQSDPQQQEFAQFEGEMGSRQGGASPRVPREGASYLGFSGGSGPRYEGIPRGPVLWAEAGGPGGTAGPPVTGPSNDYMGQLNSGLADSRAAGLPTHLHDSSDLGGWFEAEHSDQD